jgi:hypothetical protein
MAELRLEGQSLTDDELGPVVMFRVSGYTSDNWCNRHLEDMARLLTRYIEADANTKATPMTDFSKEILRKEH